MAKITFQDKVALNPQPSIANINKVSDADMNEIKNSVNELYDNTTSSGWKDISTTNFATYYKECGNIITIQCFSKANITVSGYGQAVVGIIPVELVPLNHYIRGPVYCRGNNNIYSQVNYNGDVIIFNWGSAVSLTDAGQLSFTLTYIIGS